MSNAAALDDPTNSYLILENMIFVTELLTSGTHFPQVALIVIPLTLLRSVSRLNWNRELYSFVVSHLR